MSSEETVPKKRGRKPVTYSVAQEKSIVTLLKTHGVMPTMRIMRAEQDSELVQHRNLRVFPEVTPISLSALQNIIAKYNVEPLATARGRQKGWKYDEATEKGFAELLKIHGVTGTMKIMRAPSQNSLAKERLKLGLSKANVSMLVLNRIVEQYEVVLPPSPPHSRIGWTKYKGSVANHMVSLVRKYNVSEAREILNASRGKKVALRNTNLIPKPLGVSQGTLSKMAKAKGVKITRGRRTTLSV